MSYPVNLDTDLACAECLAPIAVNHPYSERLLAMLDDAAIIEPVCVGCATEGAGL